MRYLGGKYKIRKPLAAAIRAIVGDAPIWEPFCGGVNLSGELLPAVCSDHDASLIALYRAVDDGWDPPSVVTEATWRAARLLPESDPMHAFCAFGCSFGGCRYGGYARSETRNYAQAARRAVMRDVYAITRHGGGFEHLDFLTQEPSRPYGAIYCDPPYAGTTGYGQAFDHAAFWDRVRSFSCPVLVSEYTAPPDFDCVWEKESNLEMAGGTRTERLFMRAPLLSRDLVQSFARLVVHELGKLSGTSALVKTTASMDACYAAQFEDTILQSLRFRSEARTLQAMLRTAEWGDIGREALDACISEIANRSQE